MFKPSDINFKVTETSDTHRQITGMLGHSVDDPTGAEVENDDVGYENTRP